MLESVLGKLGKGFLFIRFICRHRLPTVEKFGFTTLWTMLASATFGTVVFSFFLSLTPTPPHPTPRHLFFFCFYFYLSFNCRRPALQIRGSSFQRLTVPSLSWLPVQLSFLFQNGARDKLLMFLEFAFERNSFNLKLLRLSLFFYRVADFFFSLSQIFPLSE